MKKVLLTLLTLFITVVSANAAKSTGLPHTFTQPDGTKIVVRLLGDEDFSWYQTVDGVLLKCIDNAFYIAKTMSDGTLESTGILAHNLDSRNAKETSAAKAQNKSLFFKEDNIAANEAKSMRKAINGYPKSYFCPHEGTVRVPIILMNYTDTVFTFTDKSVWEEYFNGTECAKLSNESLNNGYSSVKQYFKDASNGKLNFVFDIYGPYTSNNGHDSYGYNKGQEAEKALVLEAIDKADGDIKFSDYDSNNDGKVDMVYVVYAGTGRNLSQKDNDIHPSCWTTTGSYKQVDGKYVNVMGAANELSISAAANKGNAIRAGIGVTCHEMSHGLGLPDLYWTMKQEPKDAQGYIDYNNCGPEDWDLMDGGENIYKAIWPCQYAAWEKDVMGWITAEELTEPADITLYPLNKEGGKAYRVTNPQKKNEYYIIENYQYDEWNAYNTNKVGSGLMITHVNVPSDGLSLTVNNTYGKPNITILPADGFILALYSYGETIQYKGNVVTMPESQATFKKEYFYPDAQGDPYAGSKYSGEPITSVTAYKNYTGTSDMVYKYPITDIKRNSDGSMSFKFMGGEPTAISDVKISEDLDDAPIYTIDGRLVGNNRNALPHGIYIQNGHKFMK